MVFYTLSRMLVVGALEVICDESVAAQPNEPSCAWIGDVDEQPLCGGRETHRSARMIRAVHLCLE